MTQVRAVVADDHALLRESIVAILREAQIQVVAEANTVNGARDAILTHRPDIAVLDIRMPGPTGEDGLTVAHEVRKHAPTTSILLLSADVTTAHLAELLHDSAHGVGYLLKDRIAGVDEFVKAVHRVADGECVIDPDVVVQLMRPVPDDPIAQLTPRECMVLELLAAGHSNAAIGEQLFLSIKTVETHIRRVLQVFDITAEPTVNRRVMAVLKYLNARRSNPAVN